jgi:hypothetical protein
MTRNTLVAALGFGVLVFILSVLPVTTASTQPSQSQAQDRKSPPTGLSPEDRKAWLKEQGLPEQAEEQGASEHQSGKDEGDHRKKQKKKKKRQHDD